MIEFIINLLLILTDAMIYDEYIREIEIYLDKFWII